MTEYIVVTHHSYVKKEMPLIIGYLAKIAAKHGERHPEMLKVLQLFAAIKEEMEHHMQKEELVLFPRINEAERILAEGKELSINSSYLSSPISLMEQEHEYAGSMLAEIRKLTHNYTAPHDACTTYKLSFVALEAFEKDLHQHVHLENNILFLKALKLFQPTQCSLY
jgi:regulator of cell morphogenesis and NO signaling